MGRKPWVAFVIQRYGQEVAGGSELHCRQVCERLKDELEIQVLTTCARDYTTWANDYAPGPDEVNGVPVTRFPVVREREREPFRALSEKLFASTEHTLEDELEWVRAQGPFAPELLWRLRRERGAYDAIVFFTYLYYPTCFGVGLAPRKSILVPTAHNEPPIYLRVYKNLFRLPRTILYNTPEERDLVSRIVPRNPVPGEIVGVGVEVPASPDVDRLRAKHGLSNPFALYVGRVDESKGCGQMFDFYKRYVAERGERLDLVVVGAPVMPIPAHRNIRALGYLPEEEKFAAIAASRILILPSLYESLSMVVLEAWALGRPVLVNRGCEAVLGQLGRSHAGLAYSNFKEFAAALDVAALEEDRLGEMGGRGRTYVQANHRWDKVTEAYLRAIHDLAG